MTTTLRCVPRVASTAAQVQRSMSCGFKPRPLKMGPPVARQSASACSISRPDSACPAIRARRTLSSRTVWSGNQRRSNFGPTTTADGSEDSAGAASAGSSTVTPPLVSGGKSGRPPLKNIDQMPKPTTTAATGTAPRTSHFRQSSSAGEAPKVSRPGGEATASSGSVAGGAGGGSEETGGGSGGVGTVFTGKLAAGLSSAIGSSCEVSLPGAQSSGGVTSTMLPHWGHSRIAPMASSLRTASRARQVVQTM